MLRTQLSSMVTALTVLGGVLSAATAPSPGHAQEGAPPGLVVLLVVDQLPATLLAEYDSLFSGGLRRLIDGGFRYTQASHAYAQTHTAAGHATLSTGVFPAKHGVVANAWFEFRDKEWVGTAAVADPNSPLVGVRNAEGRSPANNQREGLPDWLTSEYSNAEVLTISAKDRSAIGLAARAKGRVFWIDTETGRFVTSRYYTRLDPLWMDAFNRLQMPDIFKNREWSSTVPERWAHLSRRDTVEYEGDGVHTAFPHRFVDEAETQDEIGLRFWVAGTPAYDVAIVDAALHAARALKLGEDAIPDYLGVSLSQTDIVGHAYGPHSREQLDNLLRLDREIDRLLDGLDEIAGVGGWVLAFTSDHGTLPLVEHLGEQGISAARTTTAELQEMIVAARMAERDGDPEGAPDRSAAALEPLPLAEQVFTGSDLLAGEPSDSFAVLFARSYYPGRAVGYFGQMDVLVRFPERIIPTTRERGTDHRTGYWYDRHVPLILYGQGIKSGETDVPVRAVDVAPTLADLIGLDTPDDLDGRVIYPAPRPLR